MTVTEVPQDEGYLSPREAEARMDEVHEWFPNRASDRDIGARALSFVQKVTKDFVDRMTPLHRRWRAIDLMMAGNTVERAGPNDVHVPEVYKAVETIVPRIEESIVEHDTMFRMIPRDERWLAETETASAFMDFMFDQAKVRDLIQPAARNMLMTQCAAFYVKWDCQTKMRTVRTVDKSFENGRLKKTVKREHKKAVSYYGPKVDLIDPYDFIIETKATNPQDALYVGHRVWMTIDEIRKTGANYRWQNLDELENLSGAQNSTGLQQDYWRWWRDPTARTTHTNQRHQRIDGQPQKIEVLFLYAKFSTHEGGEYQEHRMVCAGGKVMLEVRENPYEDQYRPYATARAAKNGHEFFGVGPLDNAVRINQHIDRMSQIQMRAAEISGGPIVFAEEDSDLPDSLYRVKPYSVYKGTGPIRFTQVPDGSISATQNVLANLSMHMEQTTGAFKIQTGLDTNGTATEASLSLQEGNRRLRSLIRSMGDGLTQLLEIIYRQAQQFQLEDITFPVLGKRALDLKRTHVTLSPADLVPEVKFDLVGLHSLRTYGLKATGLQSFVNAMGPFIVQNPDVVSQPLLMHEFAKELIGREEADRIVKVPTPLEQLRSQHEENELLIEGVDVEVDDADDHKQHMEEMRESGLLDRAINPDSDIDPAIARVIIEHYEGHRLKLNRQMAQDAVKQQRQQQMQQTLPPEAGGFQGAQGSSPAAGGFSDAMAGPGGQTPGENPGPADSAKYGRTGRAGMTTNQTENTL